MKRTSSAYAAAGVDIDAATRALAAAKKTIRSTATPGVVSDVGSFGGMFQLPGNRQLLVSSIDGVGTKLKVAVMAGNHRGVGEDLVNHCVNDILAQGARPLFFLDYIGAGRLDPKVFRSVIGGLARGCRRNGCALIGGETAEMPGLYPLDEYDLVGAIVGMVDRKKVITGARIRAGNVLIGLPSSGLHTNGFSLARRVLFEQARLKPGDRLPGTRRTVAQALLAVHRSYLHPVTRLLDRQRVLGIAHITGGGLIDNVPRILPPGLDAEFRCDAWRVPPVFQVIEERGQIERDEMFRVFNMGIGMVLAMREGDAQTALQTLKEARQPAKVIGRVVPGTGRVVLV